MIVNLILFVGLCFSANGREHKVIAVTEDRVVIAHHNVTLNQCEGHSATLVLRDSRVVLLKGFVGCVKAVVTAGNSVLTVPNNFNGSVEKQETDAVVFNDSMTSLPAVRDRHRRVCTFDGWTDSFDDPECCGAVKEQTRLVLNSSRLTVNAIRCLIDNSS